jgi:membrane associated rhomboid family serine protease
VTDDAKQAAHALGAEVKTQAKILGGFVGLLWVIQIVNAVLGQSLDVFGVHPRSIFGLVGVVFAPLLHASFTHLIANTLPLLVLGWFVMLRRTRDWFTVSALAALVGGLGTWLIGSAQSVHVGASVLIFGYLGHLLSRGIFERKVWPILGSIAVFLMYGGALWGVMPGQIGISWEGHLFGFLGGVLAARFLRDRALASGTAAPKATRSRIAAPTRVAPPPVVDTTLEDEDDGVEADLARLRASVRR